MPLEWLVAIPVYQVVVRLLLFVSGVPLALESLLNLCRAGALLFAALPAVAKFVFVLNVLSMNNLISKLGTDGPYIVSRSDVLVPD